MKKKLAALAITLAILAVTYGIFSFFFVQGEKHAPKAVGGMLDLTDWNFSDDGVLPLEGEWAFYPNRLLSHPGELNKDANRVTFSPTLIKVPGTWTNKMNSPGIATYRLRVKVSDTSRVYGLKTSSIQISNRIIVNGRTVGESGNPTSGPAYKAKNKPYACYFNLQPGWNEIVVQVANYELTGGGGIKEPIYFGYASQISGLRDRALAYDWIVIASFLIMGLYFVGLYSQRKDDIFLIIFGLVSIFTALFTSTEGERVIYDLFDSIPYWLYYRIQILSALCVGMGLFYYLYTAFRPFCSRWLVHKGIIVGAVLAILSIGFLTELNTGLFLPVITIYATFPLLYATYVFVLAALHQVEGSVYLVVAAFSLNAYAVIQNTYIYFSLPVYRVAPFEPFLFLLMIALMMSLRFSNAFRKIEELSEQLLRANKLKDEFLARTSHEFKSPLHGIMNISKSMLDDASHSLTEAQRERLQLITNITGKLSQLVYDILDFSRLKQGELTINPVPIDVRSIVEVHLRIYSYLSNGRNIRMVNRVSDQLPYALADESRFGQIIGNLLDNAIKHTQNGMIEVSAAVHNGMIEISVQDTGEGIEEEEIPNIFEPFKSLNSSMDYQGFGLGLAIVRQLVELQNGEISVSSVKGEGTRFTFTLPVAKNSDHTETYRRRIESPVKEPEYSFKTPHFLNQNGKHTVLIADDNFSNLKILIDALQPLGCNVIAVQNGYEVAEQISRQNAIDLVILDLMMPGMSGYEVCQLIRSKYTLLELPVLMVTAAIQPQDKVAAFEAGANDFLPKPFDLAELKARIGSLLVMKESFGKAIDLEVAFLQSQIKPHFLYNVLNSIVASSYTDVERSRKLTTHLADYLRGSFQFSNIEKRILFQQELSLIQSYVEIERARFKDRIRIQYDIAEWMYHVSIPPLIIQPLVENAIRHGIGNRIEGGTVKISAYEAQGQYHFVIEDDGIGIEGGRLRQLLDTEPDMRRGVGLLNINKRLKYGYGTALKIDSEPGKGTKVIVQIPAKTA
jgi:signal transduction histidine kinase